ncbi:release factor glutamine methyltransferase [Streptacidiphilus sp. BW17]
MARLRAAGCVFAEDEADLLVAQASSPAELEAMTTRRVDGLPLEHVLGWAEFCGLRVHVDHGVFVPRPRTEFLVQQALLTEAATRQDLKDLVVVDLCCGSGALGAAVSDRLRTSGRSVSLHAADIDPAAVECARRNIAPYGGHAYAGDLFDALPAALRGRIDVLLANVPYVPTEDVALLPAEARDYEALVALDGGADGLAVLRRAVAGAAHWLAPGGVVLVETSERQEDAAMSAFAASRLTARVATSEEYWATVVIGERPAA